MRVSKDEFVVGNIKLLIIWGIPQLLSDYMDSMDENRFGLGD